jgi:hypothetical protein
VLEAPRIVLAEGDKGKGFGDKGFEGTAGTCKGALHLRYKYADELSRYRGTSSSVVVT